MARIKGINKGGSLFTRITFFFSKRKVGKIPTPVRIKALHSQILKGYGIMEIFQEKATKVSGAIKILSQVRVATLIGCPFWIDIGSAVSRKLGITEEKLQDINNYVSSSVFSAEEKAVLRYADAMTNTPVEIPDKIFQKLFEYYNDSQIIELTSAIAWENYRARFDHALKVESDGFSKGAFCPLPA